jgi:DNA repair exonuclease SbcCD ATPase subunit
VVILSALKKRILAMEEQMHHGKRQIASLRRELSRVHESLEERIRTPAESRTRRAHEVEQHIGEAQSEVEDVREALREVREWAEGVQTKAGSTEARFEAEVSALRTAPVVPTLVPLTKPPAVLPIPLASAVICPACGVPSQQSTHDSSSKQFLLLRR